MTATPQIALKLAPDTDTPPLAHAAYALLAWGIKWQAAGDYLPADALPLLRDLAHALQDARNTERLNEQGVDMATYTPPPPDSLHTMWTDPKRAWASLSDLEQEYAMSRARCGNRFMLERANLYSREKCDALFRTGVVEVEPGNGGRTFRFTAAFLAFSPAAQGGKRRGKADA